MSVARHRDEDVSGARRLAHGHDAEAVHDGFDRLDRIDLRDYDVRAEAPRAHRQAFAAPAVADHHKAPARQQYVRRAYDAVNRRLPCAVAVVEEVLRLRVVHGYRGEGQDARQLHRAQAHDARRGLFRGAYDLLLLRDPLLEEGRDDVRPVVYNDLRVKIQGRAHVPVVGLGRLPFNREDRDAPVCDQRRGHVVLRREWVGGDEERLGAAGL